MAEISYRDAVTRGIAQEMARDPDVVFLGEDVAKPGGCFKATVGLYEQFGGVRVRDTPIKDVIPIPQPAADRASAYGLERILIDGNDADVVYRTAQKAFARARAGEGPSLIECLTYRHSGHSRADPAKYRPEGELEEWKKHDPVKIYRERLKQFGVSDAQIAEIDASVRKEVDDATEACKAAPSPPLDIITTDVYADGGWAWRN